MKINIRIEPKDWIKVRAMLMIAIVRHPHVKEIQDALQTADPTRALTVTIEQ